MAVFGNESIGAAWEDLAGGYKQACPFNLTTTLTISSLFIYLDGNGTGTGNAPLKGIIYEGTFTGGATDFVAVSSEIVITDGQSAGWVEFVLTAPVELAPRTGDNAYYLGFMADTTASASARCAKETIGSNSRVFNEDTYSDGPSDPFSPPGQGQDQILFSVYAFAEDAAQRIRTPKRLVGPTLVTNSPVTGYTVPANYVTRMRHVHISNPSGSPVDMTLSIGTDAAATRLLDGKPIAADSVYEMACDEALAAGEIVQMFASSTNVLTITISGEEWVPA